MLLIETMSARHEAVPAAEVAARLAPGRWMISFCVKTDGPPGAMLQGAPLVDVLPYLGDAAAVGVNCVVANALAPQVTPSVSRVQGSSMVWLVSLGWPP